MEDNENRQEILIRISELKCDNEAEYKEEIQKLIEKFYPGWLEHSTNSYSNDYLFLQNNWKKICELNKTTPKKLIFVSSIEFKPEFSILNKLCDFLTRNGYCIRRSNEFVLCEKCNKAIPSIELWELIKNKPGIPSVWSESCSTCQSCSSS